MTNGFLIPWWTLYLKKVFPVICDVRRIVFVVMLCLTLASISCVPGQRLLTVQAETDGSVVYEGMRAVPDSTPVVELWDVLDDVSFEPVAVEQEFTDENANNPRVLEGAIVVRIKHVKNELADASIKKLTLRHAASENAWKIERTEIERIKVAAEQ